MIWHRMIHSNWLVDELINPLPLAQDDRDHEQLFHLRPGLVSLLRGAVGDQRYTLYPGERPARGPGTGFRPLKSTL